MRQYFFYKAFRKTIIEFMNIFNDIKIAKYDNDGNIIKYIDVPIKLAPKSKFYYWLYSRSHEVRLPMISVEVTDIEHANDRLTGKHEKNYIETVDGSVSYYLTPAPYDITFELKIGTEYHSEADQIIEQILPFFNPFVYTKLEIPEVQAEFNLKVLFQGLSADRDVEMGEDENRKIVWNLTFRVQGYLLQPKADVGEVRKVVTKFYTTEDAYEYANNETEQPSGAGHDAEELLVTGSYDNDGNELVKYEIW